ncbi:MAG: type II toxin-antitoxin system VapC family toxin [Pseudomonadota bacterium]
MNYKFLLDTHALVFWINRENMSQALLKFLDEQDSLGLLMVSNISFWEIGLLVQKGRLELNDIFTWKAEIFKNTRLKLITPSIDELIQSTQLPEYHKDPFDRILITQTNWHNAKLVTKDSIIPKYDVETFWI